MLYFVAIARMPVGIALLFEYTAPLFVALWARFGQRQPVRPRLWVGLALSLAGLACVAEVWGDLSLDGLGVLAGLAAAVLLAVYYVLGAQGVGQPRHPLADQLGVRRLGRGRAAAPRAAPPAPPAGSALTAHTDAGVPGLAALRSTWSILGSIAPYLLVAGALRHLPATSVGILGMIEPVIAAAVAWLGAGRGAEPRPARRRRAGAGRRGAGRDRPGASAAHRHRPPATRTRASSTCPPDDAPALAVTATRPDPRSPTPGVTPTGGRNADRAPPGDLVADRAERR